MEIMERNAHQELSEITSRMNFMQMERMDITTQVQQISNYNQDNDTSSIITSSTPQTNDEIISNIRALSIPQG